MSDSPEHFRPGAVRHFLPLAGRLGHRIARMTPGSRVLAALVLGILCGLFFGEYCGWLNSVGEGFIRLLQMTVLPFIIISLVGDLASLSQRRAGKLAAVVGLVASLLWSVGLLLITVMPFSFPDWKQGFFFRPGLTENGEPFDVLSVFIPENVFRALSNDVVPAVVLFSACLGIALMGVPGKEQLLGQLSLLKQALLRVNGAVIRAMPIGVFAISASASGTMRLEDLLKLPVYIQVYTLMTLVLAFWVLPMLVASFTPFRYREIVGEVRAAMITAFATGKVLVVLPQIIASTEALFSRRLGNEPGSVDTKSADETAAGPSASIIVSLAYPFPHLGRITSLLFVPFAAWYVGRPMELYEYPLFLGAGLMGYFGSPLVAMPALLDLQHLPADMMQLFVVTGVIASRLGDMLGAMHLFAIALMTLCTLSGHLRLSLRTMLRFSLLLAVSCLLLIGVNRALFQTLLKSLEPTGMPTADLYRLRNESPAQVDRQRPAEPVIRRLGESRLEAIQRAGVLRVGYHPDNLPFSFFNTFEELVGFDIEMAHMLARELKCRLHFIPFEYETLAEQLASGEIDIAMSGLSLSTGDLARMGFSHSYLEVTLAFVVPDHRRAEFRTNEAVRAHRTLRIAVASSEYFRDEIRKYIPWADVTVIASPSRFFDRPHDFDVLLISAEAGAAWTILHPEYEVVVPQPRQVQHPLAYALPRNDPQFESFLSHWVELKKNSLDFQQVYDQWILGQTSDAESPRWSVVRDVLGWVQ